VTKGERTKIKIIENSISLFSEYGYANTSIQAIADLTNISQAGVLKHYPSKKNLLDAVRTHITSSVVARVESRMTAEMNAQERLYAYLIGNIDWAIKNRDMAQIILLNYYMACFDDEFHRHIKHVIHLAEARVIEYTLACQREGLLHPKKNAELIAQQIHDFLMGFSMKLIASSRSKTVSMAIKTRCQSLLEHLIQP